MLRQEDSMTTPSCATARFAPPGRCIYCGTDGKPEGLRKEHIIPRSLGGWMVIPKASCKKCESVTHAIEGHTAYHFFNEVRWQNGMPSRRPKRKRPISLPAIVGDEEIKADLELPDHPSLGFFLDLPNPGIFRGMEPTDTFEFVTVHAFPAVTNLGHRVSRLPDGSVTYSPNLPVGAYIRTLAKIGHAFSVGTLGIDTFSPFLPEYILTARGPAAHLIGGTYGADVPLLETKLPRLSTKVVSHDGRQLVVARIRLFASIPGLPVYTVVVGEVSSASNIRIKGLS